MQQAQDFRDESAALAAMLAPLDDADFETPTLFKGWTINQILRHLHVWNIAAGKSIDGGEAFSAFLTRLMGGERGISFNLMENRYLDGLAGTALSARGCRIKMPEDAVRPEGSPLAALWHCCIGASSGIS